jgi:TPR repeat protein
MTNHIGPAVPIVSEPVGPCLPETHEHSTRASVSVFFRQLISIKSWRVRFLALATVIAFGLEARTAAQTVSTEATYDGLVRLAKDFMEQGDLNGAYLVACAAIEDDPERWEAYAQIALVLGSQRQYDKALESVDAATQKAPADRVDSLQKLRARLMSLASVPAHLQGDLIPQDSSTRRKLDALQLAIQEADRATSSARRKAVLNECLGISHEILQKHPHELRLWILRAAISIELDYAFIGHAAGMRLLTLNAAELKEGQAQLIMGSLERKGWLKCDRDMELPNIIEDGNINDVVDSADAGNVEDALRVGMRCARPTEHKPHFDDAKAIKYLTIAADVGIPIALMFRAFVRGQSPKELAIDSELVKNMARMGSLGSMQELSKRSQEKLLDDSAEPMEAYKWIRMAADCNDSNSMLFLATAYADGTLGLEVNEREAQRWNQLGADAGNSYCMFNLGVLAEARESWAEALLWYSRSANAGNARAMHMLGEAHSGVAREIYPRLKKLVVAPDPRESFVWHERAYALGDEGSGIYVALAYNSGVGTEKNFHRAWTILERLAGRGNIVAMMNIAQILQDGGSAGANYAEAFKWVGESRAGWGG